MSSDRRKSGNKTGLALFGAVAVAASSLPPLAADPAPIADLAGRWSGWGAVTLSSGQSEQVKCVAVYTLANAGASIEQSLRCASPSYRIDASARLDILGETVSGSWEERSHDASGKVAGRLTRSGFELAITGEHFSAAMAVATSTCKQTLQIKPDGVDIARIAVNLEKC